MYKLPIFLAIVIVIGCIAVTKISASSSTNGVIRATVQLSVCGNGKKEEGEECDKKDLGKVTCKSFSYVSGTLGCDKSCSFDTGSCSNFTTQAVESTASTPSASLEPAPTNSPTPTPMPTPTPTVEEEIGIKLLDPNNKPLKFQSSRLAQVVEAWVKVEKKVRTKKVEILAGRKIEQCDLNSDGRCNAVDFSILLYNISP